MTYWQAIKEKRMLDKKRIEIIDNGNYGFIFPNAQELIQKYNKIWNVFDNKKYKLITAILSKLGVIK